LIMSLPLHVGAGGGSTVGGGGTGVIPPTPEVVDEVILATAGYDHTVKFWQAHTGKCVRTLQHADSQVNALEISPDGQMLAAAGYQHIRMFDVHGSSTAGPVVNYEGVSKNVMSVGFQEAAQWMFTAGEDGTARTWDLRMRNLQCRCVFQAGAPVNSAVLHPNQHELVVGDANGVVHIWDMRAKAAVSHTPEPGASVQCVAIDPTANFIACTTNKCSVHILSAHGADSSITETEASQDGKENDKQSINSSSGGKRLQPVKKISDAHKRYALKCKFSPDSSILVTSSADQTCRVWDVRNDFEFIAEMTEEKQRWVWDIAFSADSQYLFTASSDNLVRLSSIPNEANNFTHEVKCVYGENGHQKAVTCLAFREGSVIMG